MPARPTPAPPTATVDVGDVSGFAVTSVDLSGRELLVAVADTSELRQRGLMEVELLGDLDGMVFVFERQTSGAFTMRNTQIDLDIAFFDSDGRLVDQFEMASCAGEPCPTYPAAGGFTYALEMPAGEMGELGSDVVLTIDE